MGRPWPSTRGARPQSVVRCCDAPSGIRARGPGTGLPSPGLDRATSARASQRMRRWNPQFDVAGSTAYHPPGPRRLGGGPLARGNGWYRPLSLPTECAPAPPMRSAPAQRRGPAWAAPEG